MGTNTARANSLWGGVKLVVDRNMDICLTCKPLPFIPSIRLDIIKDSIYLIDQPSSVWTAIIAELAARQT